MCIVLLLLLKENRITNMHVHDNIMCVLRERSKMDVHKMYHLNFWENKRTIFLFGWKVHEGKDDKK